MAGAFVGIALDTSGVTIVALDVDGLGPLVEPCRISPLSESLLQLDIPRFFDAAGIDDYELGIGFVDDGEVDLAALNTLNGALNLLAIEAAIIEPALACVERHIEHCGERRIGDEEQQAAGHFMQAIGFADLATNGQRTPVVEQIAVGAALGARQARDSESPEPVTGTHSGITNEDELAMSPAAAIDTDDELTPAEPAVSNTGTEPAAVHSDEEPTIRLAPIVVGPGVAVAELTADKPTVAELPIAQPTVEIVAIPEADTIQRGDAVLVPDEEVAGFRSALAEHIERAERLERDNEALLVKIDVLMAASTRQSGAASQLRNDVDTAAAQVSAAERNARTDRRRTRQLEAELAAAEREVESLRAERGLAERRAADLAERNASLEANVDVALDIQMQVFQMNAKVANLKDHLERERRKTKDAQARAQRLRQDLNTARSAPRRRPTTEPINPERRFFDEKEFYRSEIAERDKVISELTDKVVALRRRDNRAS